MLSHIGIYGLSHFSPQPYTDFATKIALPRNTFQIMGCVHISKMFLFTYVCLKTYLIQIHKIRQMHP